MEYRDKEFEIINPKEKSQRIQQSSCSGRTKLSRFAQEKMRRRGEVRGRERNGLDER